MSTLNKILVKNSIIRKKKFFLPRCFLSSMPFQYIMPIDVKVTFMLKLNETIYYILSGPESSATAAIESSFNKCFYV